MKKRFVDFRNVELCDGFWKTKYDITAINSMKSIVNRFEETGRFDAMRFNYLKKGKHIHIFYDSDVAKYIESVAYFIQKKPDGYKEEQKLIDNVIECMESAQREDGYLNSYHQQLDYENILKDRDHHELYCLGHMIEAAIAYNEATGKRKLLDIVERYCELVEKVFFIENSAPFDTPGHEEIELALYKLYHYTGNVHYRDMANGFIIRRGRKEDEQPAGWDTKYYAQDNAPFEFMEEIDGHCVRALYYCIAVADMCLDSCCPKYYAALERLYSDMVDRKMYITGGVGSTYGTESFTKPYDLPNMTAYSESCCAVAQILLAMRMRALKRCAKYGHLIERVMYNTLLSSTSLDGKAFFYVNPLEIALEDYHRQKSTPAKNREKLPITNRKEVFGCYCCPPNITRMIAKIGGVICFDDENCACIEQYISSLINSSYGMLKLDGEYAKTGLFRISSDDYCADRIFVRIPEWCHKIDVRLNGNSLESYECSNGYACFIVDKKFELELDFHIAPIFISSNPNVRANVGRVALTYGPIVYCIEGVDNGSRLNHISVSIDAVKHVVKKEDFHRFYTLEMDGFRDTDSEELYYDAEMYKAEQIVLKFIPYFAFANRGENDMLVWIRRRCF